MTTAGSAPKRRTGTSTLRTARPVVAQRFGAHMSIAGGLENAFAHGLRAGCDCLQIFVKNQRQWAAKPLADDQIAAWRAAQHESGLTPVVAHATYLLNLAAPVESIRARSIAALIDELSRCEALGVPHLVLHPGAHLGDGVDVGLARIAAALDDVHTATAGFDVRVALEGTAGQGTVLGHEFRHLARIFDSVRAPERLAICLDTCHLFAAGHDLRDPEAYQRMVGELSAQIGVHRVCCIHVNDSKRECGSRVDRHEHIGKGLIGRAGFVNLLNDPRLAAVPRILETPKGIDPSGTDLDRVNLRRLRSYVRHG